MHINMTTEDFEQYFKRIAATNEYRFLSSDAERAEYLHFEKGFKRWQIMKLTNTTPRIWRDMIKAHNEGRKPGVCGRPTVLTPRTERMLVDELILKSREGTPMAIADIGELV